jgi:hypothetical protein
VQQRPEKAAGTNPPDRAQGPTLRELLDVSELRLVASPGHDHRLSARVRWAQSTELLDPTPYLRGGELVCTVGAALTDPARCTGFVRSLVQAGAAGLCFGHGDVHDTVPASLVQACHDLELPLLIAPLGAPFSAIGEYVASRRVEAEAGLSPSAEALVSRLLTGLRSHASVASLLESAAELMGGRLELRVDGTLVAAAGTDGAADTAAGPVTTPVLQEGDVTWSAGTHPTGERLLRQLSKILEVALSERDVEAALRRERTGQLLLLVQDGLLDPTALAQTFDDVGLGHDALVVSAWQGGAAPLVASHVHAAVVGEAPGVTLVVTAGAAEVPPAATALSLPCGYGAAVPLARLGQGISQARAALELALGHGGVVGPAGLTSLDGLLEQQPAGRLEPFVDQLMAPLVAADQRSGTHHLDTLRAFLRNDGSLQRTAREQYLHVNTVRHRLTRVRQLTGRDPLVFTDRVALAIALWALDRPGTGSWPGLGRTTGPAR